MKKSPSTSDLYPLPFKRMVAETTGLPVSASIIFPVNRFGCWAWMASTEIRRVTNKVMIRFKVIILVQYAWKLHILLHCKTRSPVLRLYYPSVKESLRTCTGTAFERNVQEIYCYGKMNLLLPEHINNEYNLKPKT